MIVKKDALSLLGYSDFRPMQEKAVDSLCSGNNVLLAAPTGGGKSLVYQAAGLMRDGVAVIISPLLALMSQQVDELNRKGIQAKFLNSTLNPGEQDDLIWSLRHKHIKLLYLSPEKLVQPSVMGLLQNIDIALFAVDEAHCIAQWGQFFRPEYSQLGQLKTFFPNVPIIALTGTVDNKTISTIQSSLQLTSCDVMRSSFDRPNIHIHISQKKKAKQQILYFLHHEVPGQSGIIYCRSRKKTEELSQWLNTLGLSSLSYHSAMSEQDKQKHHKAFIESHGVIMVATTAYGMGIDIAHVRFVIHVDLPTTPESYLQEIGRAGRDGKPAKSLLLYGLQDMLQAQRFIELESENSQGKEDLNTLFELLEKRGCRRQNLLSHFDEALSECQQCDRCRTHQTEQNMTIASQKLLSLIYHTKGAQPFTTLIQILLGKRNKQTNQIDAPSLDLFGKGTELQEAQWKSVIRHLIAYQYISINHSPIFFIQLNENARQILKGEIQVILARDEYYPQLDESMLSVDDRFWHKVLAWQKAHNIIDLSDTQLRLICQHKPKTIASLSRLTGLSKDIIQPFSSTLIAMFQSNDTEEKRT